MNAIQTEVSDGTLVNINVGLEYFEQSDISVLLDQDPVPLVEGVDYEWASATVIHFLTGPVPNGVTVTLVRRTESDDMLNIYVGGAPFSRFTLDENFEQLLRLSQEFSEGLGLTGLRQALDMHGNRITDLGDGVGPGDAINLSQLQEAQTHVLRVPEEETIPVLPAALTRANQILGFDDDGNPTLITADSGSALALAAALADPDQGARLVAYNAGTVQDALDNINVDPYATAWARTPLASAVNVGAMLSAQAINLWEFANLVTNKPTPADYTTWDWTPALQAALDSVPASVPLPVGPNACVLIPAGRYKITGVVVPPHAAIYAAGAVIVPFQTQLGVVPTVYAPGISVTVASQTINYNGFLYRPKLASLPFTTTNWATDSAKLELKCMFKWGGFNRVHDLIVDMSYTMVYDCCHWVRSRHCQFNGCDIWRAASGWVFGDPLWKITPADGHLGDSENMMNGCATIWCVNAVRAYGENTILHFNDCLPYSYKPAMSEQDPGNPNLAAWNALPEHTFRNCGALIYLNGGVAANFSGAASLLFSEIQPVSTAPYVNSFGRYYLSNTHLETGCLLNVEPTGIYPPQDDFSTILHATGCGGYVSSTGGNFVEIGADCQQSINIHDCNFYGITNNNIVYSNHPIARVHVDPESFRNVTTDFFQAMHGRRPVGYADLNMANVMGTSQTFNTTPAVLVMPARDTSDIWTAYESIWYNTSTGQFVANSDIRNGRFDVALFYPSGALTDVSTFVLKVNGVQVDIKSAASPVPSVTLRATRIPRGAVVTIEVTCSVSRATSGQANCRLVVTGSV